MKTVSIERKEIMAAMVRGDNCDGSPVLVVADNGEWRIGWRRHQGEDRFHESDLILPIPSLWPDGSGNEGIEAQECIERNLANLPGLRSLDDVEDYCEEHDISAAEFCEKFLAEDWQAQVENNLEFLLSNWLAAVNEAPNDLYPNDDLYAPGLDETGMPDHQKRQFTFRWKVGAPKKNKNAQKDRQKDYIKMFGQRWSVEEGQAIQQYLDEVGLSQKEWLDRYLLPLTAKTPGREAEI